MKSISILIYFLYIASYYLIYPIIGNTLLIVSIIPVLSIYLAFNLNYAIIAQIVLIVHRLLAIKILGGDFDIMLSLGTNLGTLLNFMLLFMVNYLSTLNTKLRVVEKKLIIQNKELIITKNKAEESERLKTAFITNISHEIRTPLNAIVGFSSLLIEPNLSNQDKMDYFNNIQQSSNRLIQQIDGFLEMSSLLAEQIPLMESEFRLNDLMRELSANATHKLKSNSDVELLMYSELKDGVDMVISDRMRLIKILNVLIDNAIKFTNRGYVKITYEINDKWELKFSVEDTGIGISSHYKDIIFDCFRQGEDEIYARKFEGSGLGLAISKASVQFLKGKIWFTSTPGKGSTFYLIVPYKPVSKKKNKFSINSLSNN